MELTEEQIKMIEENEWVILSTANQSLQPHCIIVMPSKVESNRIILSNIQMETSIKNLEENNKCCINVYCQKENDTQIKIHGKANIFKEGDLYHEIKNYEETNNLPENLKVHSIIVVEIEDVKVSQE